MSERKSTDKFQDAVERLAWEIVSTSIRLDELRGIWARMIGITVEAYEVTTTGTEKKSIDSLSFM